MDMTVGDLRRAAAFAPGMWRFLGERLSLAEARAEMERRLASRESRFLGVLQDGILANPRSPYRVLLGWAGAEYGDVETMVATEGLEPTLEALHRAGVYVTFDEFKGREPIVRDGRTHEPTSEDFINPLVRPYSFGRTGGSTGPSMRVPLSWAGHRDTAVNVLLYQDVQGLLDDEVAYWFSTPEIPVQAMLQSARYGKRASAWFVPPPEGTPRTRRAFLRYFAALARVRGVRIPGPQPVRLEDARVVAHWAAQARDRSGSAAVSGFMSQMVRVARAAEEEGLDLTGVVVTGSGEPTTPAKVGAITGTGARFLSEYWCNELGPIAFACADPLDGSDLHLFEDRLALIQRPQQVPRSDIVVDAFCFTSLMASAPMALLNTELDDFGIVEQRACGCPLEAYGLTTHVRDVRSYRKLTGEGITLVGGELERVLEEVLPARFGGSALDYQVIEEEDEQGLTRLSLVISPRVDVDDEGEVVRVVLDTLGERDELGRSTAALWGQAETLRVKRQEPVRTGAGKLMPLHVVKRAPATQRPDAQAGDR